MRSWIASLGILITLIATPASAQVMEPLRPYDPAVVRVAGRAEVYLPPDEARIRLSYYAPGRTAAEATNEISARTRALDAAVRAIDPQKVTVERTDVSVTPVMREGGDRRPDRINGYEASAGVTVRVAQHEHVRTITLDRPDQLNALNDQLVQELAQALKDAAADAETRCVVVTGAGRAFCAGRDIADLREITAHDVFAPAVDLTTPMTQSGKIFIAAINGPVAGAALGFIMAADFRVASTDATFTPGFIALGLAPDVGAAVIGRSFGYAKALEFFLLGRKVSAADALDLGLVNRVFASDSFSSDVAAFAESIAGLPPLAVAETKRLLRMSDPGVATEVLWAEAEAAARLMRSEDHREGVRAFGERRAPIFRGR